MEKNETFEVRDMRHKEKFFVDDEYLNGYAKSCGVYATSVYLSLCRHADKEQKCWPSIRKIAKEHNISPTMVQKGIKDLKDYRIILTQQIGKGLNNRYLLLDRSEWISVPQSDTPTVSHRGTPVCHHTPVSVPPHNTGVCHHTPIHSKDTHIRIHSKVESAIALTPAQNAREFFDRFNQGNTAWINNIGDYWLERAKQLSPAQKETMMAEIKKFVFYWTESNKSGTKVRWELEKTFEIGRRLITWLSRTKDFGNFYKKERKGITLN